MQALNRVSAAALMGDSAVRYHIGISFRSDANPARGIFLRRCECMGGASGDDAVRRQEVESAFDQTVDAVPRPDLNCPP